MSNRTLRSCGYPNGDSNLQPWMLRYQHSNALGSPLTSDRCQERAVGLWNQRVLGCWDQDWLERRAWKASDRAQDRKPRPFGIQSCVLGAHGLRPYIQTGEDLRGGVRPYALTDHIHERESGYQLSKLMSGSSEPLKLSFIPSVAPWFSGIISVLNAPLKKEARADDIWKLYEDKYAGEPLVNISRGVPDVMDAAGKHGWRMGGVQLHSSLKRVVVVVSKEESI